MTIVKSGIMGLDELRDLLGGGDEREEKRRKPRPLAEAQVMELTDLFERVKAGNPFKPGDLVTPRSNSYLKLAGEPHIVLETFDPPHRSWDDDSPSSMVHGMTVDTRIAAVTEEGQLAYWTVDSSMLETWSPVTNG